MGFENQEKFMDLKDLILKALKLKAKSFGFNEKELESVAAVCANNLNVTEETEESERDAAINRIVDETAIPFLKASQSAANRAIEAYKKAHPATDPKKDPDPNPDPDPDPAPGGGKTGDNVPEYVKALTARLEKLEKENGDLRNQRVSTGRKERLQELVKGTGRFGENFLKNFDRMSFKDDADFEEYLTSVKTEVDGYKQDLANHGLESLGNPPAPEHQPSEKKLDQSVIDAMADMA